MRTVPHEVAWAATSSPEVATLTLNEGEANMTSTQTVPRSVSPAVLMLRALAMAMALALATQAAAQTPPPAPPTFAYGAGSDAKLTGLIISRRGDNLLVRDETTGQLSMVSVSSSTKIESKAGWMDMQRKT